MRKIVVIISCFIINFGFSQSPNKQSDFLFKDKITTLKNQNNLEEYLYIFFDEYVKTNQVDLLKEGIKTIWRNPKINSEKIAFIHLKINIAYSYLQSGDISKSVAIYEEALRYFQENNISNYNIISYCLKPLANNYTRLGDFERAEELYKYTINIALKNNNKEELIGTYINLSILLKSINKTGKAIEILEKTLKIKGINKFQKQKVKSLIAQNYVKQINYKKALYYLDKLDNNYQNNITKAQCYTKIDKLDEAKKHIIKALNIAETEKYSARILAKTHNQLAKIHTLKNQNQEALNAYQNSLKKLLPNFNIKNTKENTLADILFAENTLLDIFDGKAEIFVQKNQFKKAITNYHLAFKVSQLLLQVQSAQQSRIIQQQENRERTEKMVDLYYKLYKKTNDNIFIEKAFESVELSKSTILLNQINLMSIKNNINDSLLLKEQDLIRQKAILSKNLKLEELKNNTANINLIKSLINQKAEISTELEVLKNNLKKRYSFLNNMLKPISINEITQVLLKENQQIIEFFDTPNIVYVFSLSKNKPIEWRVLIKGKNYNSTIQTFINLFITNNGNKLKENVKEYQKSAYFLYEKLLKPELENNLEIVTIIPDGKLNFIAFDALLTKEIVYSSFEKLPYLLYNKQLNYGYSVNILANQKKQTNQTRRATSILGFFPLFENNFRGLQELTYTLDEAEVITGFKNHQLYKKEKATKEQFLKTANKHNILHLSTHASAGTFEIPAHIEFREQTLYLPEIYGLNFQSNLIILSACETGVGKLQKGEGAMSLARGFLYAGIKNLLVSQWKVNDKSTSILMRNFYTNYKKSNNSSSALHQAKLNYLQNSSVTNLKKTPYYWAGFQFIGNYEAVKTQNYYLIISVIILLLLLSFFYFIKK